MFYVSVAEVEPIFHLETLVKALDDSHSEKSYLRFLIGLSKAHLHFICRRETEVTDKVALSFRRRLVEILDLSRCVLRSYEWLCVDDQSSHIF